MSLKDLVIHFYTKSFRGSLCKGSSVTEKIRDRSSAQDLNLCRELHTSVLNTILQSALLKGEERIRTISEHSHISHGGTYDSIVYTEKWGSSFIRGFADKLEAESLNDKNSFLLGKTLYGSSQEYQTVTNLNDQNLGLTETDLQMYFNNSEQIPSKIRIISENWQERGLKYDGLGYLIQLMPGVEPQYLNDLVNDINKSEVINQMAVGEVTEEGFKALFNKIGEEIQYEVKEFEFKCNCSKESMMKFIENLDINELVQIRKSKYSVSCSFCNEEYFITTKDIDMFIK